MTTQEFAERVRTCTPKLWRISYLILRRGADCDDALQEALLRAWKNLHTLREEAYFETWLTRILIRESNRILRRRGHETASDETAAEKAAPDNRELHDALAALPASERVAVALHYMEGYRQKEIAAMLGVPETVVQWRLRSARKHLKNLLESRGAEE